MSNLGLQPAFPWLLGVCVADSYENFPQLERAILLRVTSLFLGQLIPNDCSMQGHKCQAPVPQSETTVEDHLCSRVSSGIGSLWVFPWQFILLLLPNSSSFTLPQLFYFSKNLLWYKWCTRTLHMYQEHSTINLQHGNFHLRVWS